MEVGKLLSVHTIFNLSRQDREAHLAVIAPVAKDVPMTWAANVLQCKVRDLVVDVLEKKTPDSISDLVAALSLKSKGSCSMVACMQSLT